jgi:alpha-tubulin suppressor-like RCC1 family protein
MFNKSVKVLVLLCFIVTSLFSAVSAANKSLIGDLNGDGSVNSTDYALMKRYILGTVEDLPVDDDLWVADVNGDARVSTTDYSILRRFLLRIIDKFPKEQEVQGDDIYLKYGSTFAAALKPDGTVWVWGDNRGGQLGLGDTTSEVLPVDVPGLPKIKKITNGLRHTLALAEDGTLWAWGNNDYLQLIDDTGTKTYRMPFKIVKESDVKDVEAGVNKTIVVRNDGTVCIYSAASLISETGSNKKYSPQEISGLEGLKTVSIGLSHIVALKEDGTVWTAGDSYWGQLGTGAQNHHNSFSEVFDINHVTALEGITQISAGRNHSVALKGDGTVWTWGCNLSGELGSNINTVSFVPLMVEGLEDIIAVCAGDGYTVALKNDGTVWTWGMNDYGQLGDGTKSNRFTPMQVEDLDGVKAIEAGWDNTVAYKEDGTIWVWGRNDYGQLGDGTTEQKLTPVKIKGLVD